MDFNNAGRLRRAREFMITYAAVEQRREESSSPVLVGTFVGGLPLLLLLFALIYELFN